MATQRTVPPVSGLRDRAVLAVFVAVFPGFVVYHTLVDRGWLPRFLGGYSTAAALATLPVLLVDFRRRVLRGARLPRFDAAFLAFLAFFALVTLGHAVTGASPETVTSHASSILQFLALFLLARALDVRSRTFQWAALSSFAVVAILLVWNTTGESVLRSTLDFTIRDDRSPDYQGTALVFTVLLILVAGTSRSARVRVPAYLVALPVLFLNGARSEFAALFVVVAIVELCRSSRRPALVLAGAGSAALLVATGGVIAEALGEALPASRVLTLASGQVDDSALERLRYFHRAWDTVSASPITGAFASYPPGEYAHNFLSVWVDLGLVGLLAYAALLVVPVATLLRRFREDSREDAYVLALASTVIVLILAAVAKDFTYRLFPVAMGLYAAWREPGQAPGDGEGGGSSRCQANRIP